ncbi:autotransporter outer membrane beta-barrel domain-containing protein [Mesorhizobium erdmanii]|uniref:Autotransporter outer membrane beta-barrel domain-containing protein n=2 Tax=Mesorhizobium TaxID=68287 RepID=A0A3M9XHF1_9HYPH|nr:MULTISPECIES: autotransporter outer membrane beta-barrel domain-containing protein [Mesorhizobium]RNJ47255.1 autotransporter outer membrane beta-barrel domain-containing protein [Mesorhizobium japonicum]RXT40631.1 autotransporter outer membrane beta-barrel domain-containing protein [Mesorhizobium erdmanii]
MPQHGFGSRKAKALKYLALTSTALVCLGQPITASADAIWTGAASTDWFTAGNWKNSAVPTSGDDVLLNPKFPNPTVIDGGNAAAHYLFLGTIASYTGSLTIKSGGTLASTAGFVGYLADANGVVTVTGAGSAWNNSSDLFLAASPSSTGTLTISNGGAVSDTVGHVGSGGTGTVTVDGIGSTWTNSGDLYIAEHGTGTLAITKGGAVSNAVGTIGWHAGSNGTVTVDGAGSTWTNSSNLFVGDQGTGALTVSSGGAVSNLSGILGNLAGSTGTATVDGVGSTWHNAALAVGNAGFGVLTISNGGVVTSSVGYAAYAAGSTGAVVVDGPGSAWKNSSNLFIGDQGTGALTVTGGGAVSNALGYVGDFAGSTGMVFVDGAGSTWSNTSSLFVGNFGTGDLAITHGGAVSNDAGLVGAEAGSTGMVFVDGAGSTWTSSGNLTVGNLGTGTLAISNGGSVVNQTGFVGDASGSSGMVFVDGAGSTWSNTSNLFVGNLGTGNLAITHGGAVSNDAGLVGVAVGASGSATVDGIGSVWTNNSSLTVGEDGTGTLAISNGGKVTSTAGYLSFDAGSVGTVTVSGAGSTWTNSDLLIVGQRGTGSLIVSNGGKVANTNGFVGGSAGSIGMASISGANSTWANSGDLYVGGFGPGTLTIANGGTVSAGGMVNIAGFAGTIGTLNIGAASGSPATAAGALNAASIKLGPGAGTINFNHTDTNYIFASAMSGAGTINQIAGNTNLTADSSGFTGATNVSGGRLAVNGSLAGSLVTISGGTLGGNGTVGGIVAQSGGIIAPGNSIGTLNVAGDIDQAAGSIYQVELTTTGQSDLLHATGKATIAAGAILDVVKTDAAPYVPGAHFTVLQADAGVTGTYSVSGVGPFTGLFANYDATHVYLDVVQAKSFAEVGLTPNQMATGGGAESLGAGNPLFDAIVGLPSEAAAQNAFDQLSGEIHASAKGMLLEDSSFIRDAASNRIASAFGDSSTAALPVMAYGEGGPEMVAADTDRFAVWGQAFGSWGNVDSDGNAAAFDRSTGGLLAGADTLLGDWRVGLLGGYSHSSFNADDRNSSGKSDNYHLGLYGGTNWGAIAFRTGAAYSWSSLSTHRSVAFNGFTDGLSADYDAGTAQMFGELAYKAETSGSFKFEPFANLAYVSVHTDGFSETGGAAALTSAGTSTNATFTTLGLRGSTDFALGGVNATARGMLGWRHAFGDVTPTSSFAFAGGDAFTIAGVPIARDAAVIEAGIDMKMSPNATLGLSYSGQFGGGAVDNGAKANLSVKF